MKINIFNKQKKFEEEVLSGEYPSSIYSVQMSMDEIFYPELFTELEFL